MSDAAENGHAGAPTPNVSNDATTSTRHLHESLHEDPHEDLHVVADLALAPDDALWVWSTSGKHQVAATAISHRRILLAPNGDTVAFGTGCSMEQVRAFAVRGDGIIAPVDVTAGMPASFRRALESQGIIDRREPAPADDNGAPSISVGERHSSARSTSVRGSDTAEQDVRPGRDGSAPADHVPESRASIDGSPQPQRASVSDGARWDQWAVTVLEAAAHSTNELSDLRLLAAIGLVRGGHELSHAYRVRAYQAMTGPLAARIATLRTVELDGIAYIVSVGAGMRAFGPQGPVRDRAIIVALANRLGLPNDAELTRHQRPSRE